jgi:hypothetical protein
MNYLDSGYPYTVVDALHKLWSEIILYLPNLVVAIIVLIVGWALGTLLGSLVYKLLAAIKIDSLADSLGLDRLSARAGRKFSVASLGRWVVKWFFFIGSLIAASDILGLTDVTKFLYEDVLTYAGHVIVAVVILLLGILAANFFADIVASAVKASGLHRSPALSTVTRWAILVFTVIAVLSQLQIASSFFTDLFRAVVAMLAIAGGLAFGLGGRDHAKKILDEVERGFVRRE